MYLKRMMYLGYYLKEMDWGKFKKFLEHSAKTQNRSKVGIVNEMLISFMKYNISLLEFFQFQFYKLSKTEKESYAGTGFMYEYHIKMNPKSSRDILEDKLKFLSHYSQFVKHQYASLQDLESNSELGHALLSNKSGKIVLKNSSGQCGDGIEVRKCSDFSTVDSLINRLKETGNDLVEEFVMQHDQLNTLSPSGLNTIRIFTQLTDEGRVDILGTRLRITVNSTVDNLAAGNIAAPINIETGIVDGPAIYSDITKLDVTVHPITNVNVLGFHVPFWDESLEMVKKAALISGGNKSIGWDIAITNSGPELIEGNHNWCKLLWQLPVKKGLKGELLKYL